MLSLGPVHLAKLNLDDFHSSDNADYGSAILKPCHFEFWNLDDMQTMGLPLGPDATLRNLDDFQLGFHETLIQKSALKVENLEKKSKKFLTVFLEVVLQST